MNTEHRQRILNNIDALVRDTDYSKLMSMCLANGLISSQMCKNIETPQPTNDDQLKDCHRRLFEKITHRGPDAFDILMKISALEFPNAVRILNGNYEGFLSLGNSSSAIVTPSIKYDGCVSSKVDSEKQIKLKEYTGTITNYFNVKKSARIHTDEKAGVYPMKTKNDRGILFLVNIVDFQGRSLKRNGAHNDANAMVEVFTKLGFKIFFYTDCTCNDFFHLLDEVLKSDYTYRTECFMLVLMTHGSRNSENVEYVEFHDGAASKVIDIENRFTNQNCPNLRHKPKILIFPFCRGDKIDKGMPIETDSFRQPRNIVKPIPTMTDVLICYATHRGFEAHRHPVSGSWYIQDLCRFLAENAHDTHFETIIKMVQKSVDKKYSEVGGVQTPSTLNVGFSKHLYLNPGQWEIE